jgi:hypothetical protein
VTQNITVTATVPGIPKNVTITAPASGSQVIATFAAPDSDGGSPITSYMVTSFPGSFTGTGTSPITVTGLSNGTPYTFTVTAINAVGIGLPYTTPDAITPAAIPGAPTGVAAAPGNTQATISFTPPAYNGGSAITGYTVASNPVGGIDSTAGTTGLSHVVTGLTNGVQYTFTVTATNRVGAGAASVASSSVTPAPTVPGAPTNVTATAGNAQATVTFSAPTYTGGSPITSYTVSSIPADGVDANAGSASLSHVITGLKNGTAYAFTVTANSANGPSLPSTSNSVTPAPTIPGAPTISGVAAGDSQVTVTFAQGSDGGSAITGYTVTSKPAGGVDANAGSTSLNHVITGLANKVDYTFTVTATNAVGTSTPSAASTSVKPFTPISFTVTATAGANGSMSPTTQKVVAGATASFAVTPNAGFQIAAVTGCSGTLSGTAYITAGITGDCTVNATFVGVPSATQMGDLNGDGAVTIADALLALQFAIGLQTPTAAQIAIGDLKQHGTIDIADVVAILNKTVGQ